MYYSLTCSASEESETSGVHNVNSAVESEAEKQSKVNYPPRRNKPQSRGDLTLMIQCLRGRGTTVIKLQI